MSENFNDFPVVMEIPVRWGDMDARGHVNNTIYYRYFESTRIALFQYFDIYEEPTEVHVGPILSFQSCYYKAPLVYPDTVLVGAKIIGIEGSKIIIKHLLFSKKLNRIAAEGEAHIIWYNYEEKKKVNISDELKSSLLG
ncbi:MAG: acyl-CoA thioesterase [Promethearchaeota archaeon]